LSEAGNPEYYTSGFEYYKNPSWPVTY